MTHMFIVFSENDELRKLIKFVNNLFNHFNADFFSTHFNHIISPSFQKQKALFVEVTKVARCEAPLCKLDLINFLIIYIPLGETGARYIDLAFFSGLYQLSGFISDGNFHSGERLTDRACFLLQVFTVQNAQSSGNFCQAVHAKYRNIRKFFFYLSEQWDRQVLA